MFIVDSFLNGVTKEYGKHPVSNGDITWYSSQAYNFMKLKYHMNSAYEKSLIGRTMQYVKDRTDNLMIIFLAKEKRNVN